MNDREKELMAKGLIAEEREWGELVDNCYRAGAITSYTEVPFDLEELRVIYRKRLDELGYQ